MTLQESIQQLKDAGATDILVSDGLADCVSAVVWFKINGVDFFAQAGHAPDEELYGISLRSSTLLQLMKGNQ